MFAGDQQQPFQLLWTRLVISKLAILADLLRLIPPGGIQPRSAGQEIF